MVRFLESLLQKLLHHAGLSSQYLELDQGRQHRYHITGSGRLPPILLFHGIGASASSYANLMLRLAKHSRQVQAIDLPGHGLSDPLRSGSGYEAVFETACTAAFAALDEPAIVFGNSLGGACAVEFSRRYPERVAGLVLCSPAGAPIDAALFDGFLSRFAFADLAAANRFLRSIYANPPWYTPLLSVVVKKIFASTTIRGILSGLRPNQGLSPDMLTQMRIPVELIWGRADKLMLPQHRDFYLHHLPVHASIKQPEHFGHCPFLEHPGEVSQMIVEFTQKIDTNHATSATTGGTQHPTVSIGA